MEIGFYVVYWINLLEHLPTDLSIHFMKSMAASKQVHCLHVYVVFLCIMVKWWGYTCSIHDMILVPETDEDRQALIRKSENGLKAAAEWASAVGVAAQDKNCVARLQNTQKPKCTSFNHEISFLLREG